MGTLKEAPWDLFIKLLQAIYKKLNNFQTGRAKFISLSGTFLYLPHTLANYGQLRTNNSRSHTQFLYLCLLLVNRRKLLF